MLTSVNNSKANKLDLEVYPNPSTEEITINWTSTSEQLTIEIFDLLGSKIYSKAINNNEGSYTIQRSEMKISSGTYILKCKQGNSQSNTKITIL